MSRDDDGAEERLDPLDERSGEHERGAMRQSRITARPAASFDSDRPSTGRLRFEGAAARRAHAAGEGRLEPPSSEEMLATVVELNRTVGVEMQEEAIVHRYVEAMRSLFPERRFAVRLFGPERELVLAYATAPLDDALREHVALSEAAIVRHELDPSAVAAAGLSVEAQYQSVFRAPGAGFDVPLMSGGRLVGVLDVEYAAGLVEPGFDRSLVVPLAVQLGAALRNARLLRESDYLRRNMEKLLDHANAPIVVIGRDRALEVVNRSMLGLVARDRDDLIGRDFLSLLPETERGRILPVFIRALRGEPTSNFEVRLPRRDGTFARLVINTASILDPDGEVEGVIGIGRDMTEVRQLEEQVIQAEKLATLGQLAAGVVHELNNPLTSISVYGEYLLKKGERAGAEDSDLEKLRRIVGSADRILKFTRDLVTYARPSTEEPAFVPIRSILEQSLLFCDHLVADVKAVVTTRYEADEVDVYAVKGQLHQVFINLITNACHALPAEDGRLLIRTWSADDGFVQVEVSDNGHGIPDEHRGRIFEPFYSTKGEGEGTGLGLSIVRNIVQQHGGEIEVRPGEPSGTLFALRFPGRATGPAE